MILVLAFRLGLAAECHGQPGAVHPNHSPIDSNLPRFVKRVPNGKLFLVGSDEMNTTTKLIHVYGTMYEMGYAQGQLLTAQLQSFIGELWDYIVDQVVDGVPSWVPKSMARSLGAKVVGLALDLTYYATKWWTTDKYYDEMMGLCDASGVQFATLRRIHMIGELTKGSCSMFGAWGNATLGGNLIQLRALDWDFDGPYRKYATVTVYHPSRKQDGHAWANVGFAGWLGVLSGASEKGLAVSQIGVSYPDVTFGKESRFGNPFTFVLRDVLQFDSSLDESIKRMQSTRRTCNLILGVGSGKDGQFRGFQYSHSHANVIAPDNLKPVNSTWHEAIPDVVYWGMDWLCPPFSKRLSEMIKANYGTITAESTISSILPGTHTGNLQAVVYDLSQMNLYFAYGIITKEGKRIDAFDRPFVKLGLDRLFAEKLDTKMEQGVAY